MIVGLPNNSICRRNTEELRVERIVILNTVITDCGIVDHYHHCSIDWRVRGSEFHSGTIDVGWLDTGLAVKINKINLTSRTREK